ncbi:UNVERIFIED_CONTAM: hypothetical protein GTU68_023714, partial [Idotea baltica]|nr:hypothetical protein [Idotea baltica]
ATVSQLIREIPEEERPREKLLARGAGALSNAEIMALFFGTGRPGMSAIDLGRELIDRFGSLKGISRASIEQLSEVNGIGPAKAAQLAAVFEFGHRLAGERFSMEAIDSSDAVYELLGPEMGRLNQEVIRVVLLNTRNRLIQVVEVSKGTVDQTIAHPRDILKAAVQFSASGFILVHNHPSGDPTPSSADYAVTKNLREAARVMQIEFVDHVIIGSESNEESDPFFSFREAGLI